MATLRHRYRRPETSSPEEECLPLDTICTILTRQSTIAQKERNAFSAEVDPADLIREAGRLGFPSERIRVLDWDMGKGAYNTTIEDRPALRHWLAELLPRGESRVVLVSQEDRLFRDRWEDQHNAFIRQVATHGGWVVCGVRGARVYNFRCEMDKEQFRLAGKYGRQYIEFHVKGRLHPAAQRAAMQGRYVGGMVPWGYQVDYDAHSATYKHYLRYGPHAVLVAEEVFGRFVRMERPAVVALAQSWWRERLVWPFFGEEVDSRQVRWHDSKCQRDEACGGYHFEPRQAQTILTNVVYLGWMARRGEVASNGAASEPRVCHEPLVDPDLFWWCYDRILPERPPYAPARVGPAVAPYHPRRSFSRPEGDIPFLGQGVLRCAHHGKRLTSVIQRDESRRGEYGRTFVRCWQTSSELRTTVQRGWTECPVVPAAEVDAALCEAFAEQLRLDGRDVDAIREALARAAARRESCRPTRVVDLERQVAEQEIIFERAKHLYLTAPDLAADVVEDMRRAKIALAELQARLEEVGAAANPPIAAWQAADRALGLAERISSTFLDWSRPAKGRVVGMALNTAVLGRVDRRMLGLWVRWQGGAESRRELARPNGHRRVWAAEEDAALRTHFHRLTRDALVAMLPGRAWPSIRFRAYELGLSRPKRGMFSAEVPLIVPGPPTPNEMAAYGFPVKDGTGGVRMRSSGDWSAAAA